jgi:hypothetical protein
VLSAQGATLYSGHSLLGLAQWLLGPGWASNSLAVVGTLGVFALIASIWRAGLHTDARRYVQLALLPVAAVVCSPHALAYDDVIWLASAWLLLTLVREVPATRRGVLVLLLVGWWGGNLAALPGISEVVPWGAFSALVCLGGLACLYRQSSAWGGRA